MSSAGTKRSPASVLASCKNFVGNDVERDFALLLAGLGGQFLLRGDQRLDGFLAEFQRGVEIRFGDFLGRAFIHDDVVFVADIDQVEIALGHFGMGRVGDELAVDAARRAPRRAGRPRECR